MTNINVRIVGTANVSQMETAFAALQAQVAALNKQLASMVALQKGVDPAGYNNMARAAAANDRAFRSAVASTGMFEQAQLRVNRATDDYIDQLKRQKLSFRELVKQRKVAAAAYKEQLAMEQMMVRQSAQSTARGRQVLDITYPKQVSSELNTAGRRLAFFNEQLKSGAHQMVNWGKNTQWAGRQLMVGFTMPILAAGAAAGVLAYQMDKQFTRIAKVYDTTADSTSTSMKDMQAVEKELMKLREQGTATAIKAAKEYGVAAQDTLNVQAELAATGQRGADLQKATAEVMRIARLGELDYQTATQATIALQTVFRMSTEELTESFNYMNSIENATSLTTQDFATAIPIAAGTVREFGGDVKELGVLLTAMKSRGIEASQAANGLKATMQRLGRPSKQIQKEFKEITGTDLKELVDTSGSLTEIFTRIREVTKDLAAPQRRDVFAGVFGSYQVKQMMALVDGMEDIEKGYGQTAEAARIAEQSASDWAKTANIEMERYQKSISGRWDTALQEMKIQLSTLGEPFVEVATQVLKGISWIIKGFNQLPKGAKVAVALGITLAALAGPIVMLTGLFANLFGNLIKTATSMVGLVAKMNLGTTAQRAAALHAKMATAGFISERTAVQQLTIEIEKLTAAQMAANAAMGIGAGTSTAAAGATSAAAAASTAALIPANLSRTPSKGRYAAWSRQQDEAEKSRKAAKQAADDAEREAKARAKSARNMKLFAGSAGVATAAMATMMVSSNETVDKIAQLTMVAAIIVPAFATLGPALMKAAVWSGKLASNMVTAAAASRATAGAASMGALGKLGAVLKGAPKLLGAAGVATTAILAAGTAFLMFAEKSQKDAEKAYEKSREEIRENAKQQATLVDLTKNWAKATGEAYNNFRLYNIEGDKALKAREQTSYQEALEFYRGKDFKDDREAYKDASEPERQLTEMNMAVDLMKKMGYTADEAKVKMSAFYYSMGMDASEAEVATQDLFDSITSKSGAIDWNGLLTTNLDSAKQSIEGIKWTDILKPDAKSDFDLDLSDFAPEIQAEGSRAGELWAVAFDRAIGQGKGDVAFQSGINSLVQAYQPAFKDFSDNVGTDLRGSLETAYMTSFDELDSGLQEQVMGMESRWKEILSSPEEFAKAASSGELQKMVEIINSWGASLDEVFGENIAIKFGNVIPAANELSSSFVKGAQETLGLADSVDTLAEALGDPRLSAYAFGTTEEGARKAGYEIDKMRYTLDDLKTAQEELRQAGMTDDMMKLDPDASWLLPGYVPKLDDKQLATWRWYWEATKDADIDTLSQDLLSFVNARNSLLGFTPTNDLEEALGIHDAGKTKAEIDAIKNAAKDASGDYSLTFNVKENFRDMRINAMKDVQNEIADSYRDALDEQQQSATDARQAYWDAQQERLDAKWERRKDKATEYWDNRIDLVDKAIEAEEKAEDKRQKMFDAEMARINKLNEAMNRNIDFNVALNEGNFDEAAKIRNDANAGDAQTALELAAAAGAAGSDRRVEALGKRKDIIEDRREDYMKRLEKREKAEKDALSRRVKANMAALAKIQQAEKKNLENQLDMFLAFVPKNERQLKRHMANIGLNYKQFGDNVLHPESKRWGDFYGTSMRRSIREQGLKLESDAMWEQVGKGASKRILNGMGFMNMRHFEYFIKTGKMKTDDNRPYPGFIGPVQTQHTGGVVGESGGSRKGVARTLGGLHSSEQMVRAQKGEFIVNRRDASKNRDVLEAINNGRYGTDVGVGGAGTGMAGLISGFMARALIAGIGRSFQNAATQATASSGSYSSGNAGIYGDRAFNAEQLKNAATIASVGSSMGMSTRDIMIGIMTAITESGLRNINYGDRDSLGLFQQRPSQGWGTPEQVTNPNYAARKFFEGLRGVKGRNDMAPWLAAQAVQRSFDSTGSNYKQYWDEANAILKSGLTRSGNGYTAGGFIQGAGGKHRPVRGGTLTQGLHYLNAIDFGVPRGTPVYAAADGKVVRSMDIAGPLPTDSYRGDGPYGSYGRVIEINHGGFSTLYAHLSQRYASAGQQVKGGAKIGLSGNTGNSSGPHLHFGAPGSNPYAFLKTGGTVKKDNTPALLHRDERVLTAPLTKKLDYAVDAMYNSAKYGIGGKGGRRAVPYGSFSYPGLGTGAADSPYTWMSNGNIGVPSGSGPGDTGAKTGLRIGTLNTWVKSSAKATISDLTRLIPNADFLALTEMSRKAAAIKKWLATKGWGVVGSGAGTRSSSLMAYNKATQTLEQSGQRKLGNKMASVVGGREIRYANYGLFKDRKSGRKTWQVAAHTVPAGRGLGPKNAPLYYEQWGNLNKLVNELQGGGTPVFVSGDLNVHKGAKNFQTPGNLNEFASKGVDYVFGDKKLTKLQRQWLVRGMHTDHGQHALMSQFSIPQLSKGAENIRWDNTIANLHRGESVLTADISAKFKQGVDNFANGGGPVYNDIKVYASEGMDEEALANKVIKKIERNNARKPQSRRGN